MRLIIFPPIHQHSITPVITWYAAESIHGFNQIGELLIDEFTFKLHGRGDLVYPRFLLCSTHDSK